MSESILALMEDEDCNTVVNSTCSHPPQATGTASNASMMPAPHECSEQPRSSANTDVPCPVVPCSDQNLEPSIS